MGRLAPVYILSGMFIVYLYYARINNYIMQINMLAYGVLEKIEYDKMI
jgi:hypothetical protein